MPFSASAVRCAPVVPGGPVGTAFSAGLHDEVGGLPDIRSGGRMA